MFKQVHVFRNAVCNCLLPSQLLALALMLATLLCHLSAAQESCLLCDAGTGFCDGGVGCDSFGSCDGCGCKPDNTQAEDRLFPVIGGIRAGLAESGISFQNNVTQFYLGNTSGGLEREFRYAGHGDYVMNMDFGKLGVQEGLFLKVRAEHRFGESLANATGALLPPNIITDLPVADSEKVYLTNFLITQALSENFALFAGKLDTLDGDVNAFAHGRGIRQFSNGAFVATPLALRTVPYSTLGAGFAVLLDGEPLLSFLVLNAIDTTNTAGFNELFAEGCTLTSELRLPTNFFGKPGHQLIGGSWSSREFTALGQDPRVVLPNIPIDRQSGSWSLYWNCDQYLVVDQSNPKRGWGYFGRAGIADEQTNPFGYFLSAGLGGSSPLATREHDTFGVGYYYSGTSTEIGALSQIVLGPIGDGQAVETFYNIAANPYLTITPDLQVILPARETVDTALVAGIRVNLAF